MVESSGTKGEQKVQFVVVDDHAMLVAGMAGMLAQAYPGSTVKSATTINAALVGVEEASQAGPVIIVLLDLQLADGNGIDFLRAIQERRHLVGVRTIIYSGTRDQAKIDECRVLGAKGFVGKAEDPGLVSLAIEKVLAGGECFAVAENAALHDAVVTLPPALRRVYDGIVSGKSNKEIAREHELEPSTVKSYTNRLYQVLNVKNRSELLAALITKDTN